MTEAEWLASGNPDRMLNYLAPTDKPRRCRLLAVACCRCGQAEIRDPRCHAAIDVAELYADGAAEFADLFDAHTAVLKGGDQTGWDAVAREAVRAQPCHFVARTTLLALAFFVGRAGMRRKATDFIRDLFGNPFRPVSFSPSWRTDTAVTLARTMYESREFSAIPILADALQDAGCDSEDILAHCRDTSLTHVRGCWVTDLVLGKQ